MIWDPHSLVLIIMESCAVEKQTEICRCWLPCQKNHWNTGAAAFTGTISDNWAQALARHWNGAEISKCFSRTDVVKAFAKIMIILESASAAMTECWSESGMWFYLCLKSPWRVPGEREVLLQSERSAPTGKAWQDLKRAFQCIRSWSTFNVSYTVQVGLEPGGRLRTENGWCFSMEIWKIILVNMKTLCWYSLFVWNLFLS